jgi:coenzyme F420 biosynthesis associated uncharacterized protein
MSAQMVDWDLAVAAGARLAGPGPAITRVEADTAVAELREGAARSTPLVREFTGLEAGTATAPLVVVDRRGWIQANADAFEALLTPVVERLLEKRGKTVDEGLGQAVGSKVTGLEVGGLLGFLASKVLGQFDPFFGATGSDQVGRLLLVAPNIVHTERELDVDPSDFRLWVCLHEETHRVQFTAVPWMRDHLQEQVDTLVGGVDIDPSALLARLVEAVRQAGDLVSGRGEGSLLELFATPEQREVIDRVTGVMSLLEGHADVVMDGVGPEVIPTVHVIRERFELRRRGAGSLDRLLRRLLGLEAKMAQYRNGAAFVRAVIGEVGMDGFNKVWVEPDNLPSKDEITDPRGWVRRVHG